MFYIFLGLGLLIRFLLIPMAGFKADVAFWKGWGLAVADKGIVWLVNNTNYNYPPGFAYILWLINKIYALFKNPYNISEYWADNNIFYLFLIKLVTIVADLMIVWLIIRIGQTVLNPKSQIPMAKQIPNPNGQNIKQKEFDNLRFGNWNFFGNWKLEIGISKILALFYFLNPAVIYDGVVWGQVDQFGLALFLLSVYFVLKGRFNMGAAVFTVSCLMKFQNIIFIPLFYLFIYKKFSFKELISSLAVTFLTFIIVIFPFFLGRQMERLLWLLTINADWFPWYSLNAFNGWWIASGLKGMQLTDKHLVFGITSAKQFGLHIFTFAYFISAVTVLFSKKEQLFRNFIAACTLAIFAFFHLLTQSHERYLFPVMGLLPLLVILGRSPSTSLRVNSATTPESSNDSGRAPSSLARMTSFKLFAIFYLLTSIFFFLNMYLSMGWNYPDQVIPTFTREGTLGVSFWISVIQIIFFVAFVVWYFRLVEVMRDMRIRGMVGGFGVLVLLALLVKNMAYLSGGPVSLTTLRPVGYHQDYLEPVYDKTVESARGVKFWNRLSVNYYFYEKGIGSHADSEISYHLAGKFSKFTTDFGLDTEADQSAKVYFSILGDGRELFKSEVKGRFDKPETKTVIVKGVNYLTLKITKAGESNFGAHADWLKPVLIR